MLVLQMKLFFFFCTAEDNLKPAKYNPANDILDYFMTNLDQLMTILTS